MSSGLELPAGADTRATLRVGTAEQFRWLGGIVKAVVILNLIDAVMTLWWVRTGFATEANMLLAEMVEKHALLFVVGKLALVSLGTTILWRRRRRPLAVVGIFAVFLAYYFILLYHLQFAGLMLGQLLSS
jgi:hypothetical protein